MKNKIIFTFIFILSLFMLSSGHSYAQGGTFYFCPSTSTTEACTLTYVELYDGLTLLGSCSPGGAICCSINVRNCDPAHPFTVHWFTSAPAECWATIYCGFTDPTYIYLPCTCGDGDKIPLNSPIEFSLKQNFPNPFNPATKISYSVASESEVKLAVFDILGREVSTLVDSKQVPGVYSVEFDASALPSGMYFYTLTAGTFTETKKMLLIK